MAKDMVKDLHRGDNLEEVTSCLTKTSTGWKEIKNKETNDSERNSKNCIVCDKLPSITHCCQQVDSACRLQLAWHRKKSDRRISARLLCVQTNKILGENQNEKI
jgi:hypothetical protein